MVKIAIQNIHHLFAKGDVTINNYINNMVNSGHIKYLYFDDKNFRDSYGSLTYKKINHLLTLSSEGEIELDKTEIIFSPKVLQEKCDVLLNFNVTKKSEFTPGIKYFEGLKIFHLMDYFWVEPASAKNERLKEYRIDYVMSYSSSDKHCPFFQHFFPGYIGKVIPVPFGYHQRFENIDQFSNRIPKCIALGSVNPLNRIDAPPDYWREPASFYPDDAWMHKFRRILVKEKDNLKSIMDSTLAEFPKTREWNYDIVKKFNEYQMFTSCESIFYFPPAKTFEGPASGCVLVCSNHPCFTDYGFVDGINCIKHNQFDIQNFREKILYYQTHQEDLEQIQQRGTTFVRNRYSHQMIGQKLHHIFDMLYRGKQPEYSTIWQKSCEDLAKNENTDFENCNKVVRENTKDKTTVSGLYSRNRGDLKRYRMSLKYLFPLYQVPKKIYQTSECFAKNVKNFASLLGQIVRD
jgi:hypothetical protein